MELSENVEWEPRRRVNMAIDKLMGVDPAKLIIDDLAVNPAVKKFKTLPVLTKIVLSAYDSDEVLPGPKGKDGEALLEVGEQMDRLIAISTNSNILVRHWSGLQTWL